MFGALNRFIGRLDGEPAQQPRSGPSDSAFGFQVLRNKDPELPLEPWFDFIVGINGHPIEDPDPNLFATEVRNCAGSNLTLEIWSAKHIWHILSIPSSESPAYRAGLLPHSDYIIGTPSGTLRGESALGELVEDHLDRTLVLWVYNSEFDVVREVELVPTRNWGGEGAVGAELGYGALHRLPVGLGEEVEGPGEVVFESREDGASETVLGATGAGNPPAAPTNFLVPANMTAAPPLTSQIRPSPSPDNRSSSSRRGKPRPAAFDDYFAEGEQKSREEDFAPTRKSPLPPPPKAGFSPPPHDTPAVEQVEGAPGPTEEG
ncbi:hypothetical protein N7468_010068 [Penicillium chermesinum]|uniref:PDZ GRASP-type domain-containing protein n=1 Tax=Penicillium chermesinum TaxID=63820 RepID=A0A9W9NBZ9_9EURO|nr:uncharacterized protein N7468_010068 [Penicillium chermesinum]KAJ5217060.1 hypothetical protein N7468_010068 [Penicillium chermesinum]